MDKKTKSRLKLKTKTSVSKQSSPSADNKPQCIIAQLNQENIKVVELLDDSDNPGSGSSVCGNQTDTESERVSKIVVPTTGGRVNSDAALETLQQALLSINRKRKLVPWDTLPDLPPHKPSACVMNDDTPGKTVQCSDELPPLPKACRCMIALWKTSQSSAVKLHSGLIGTTTTEQEGRGEDSGQFLSHASLEETPNSTTSRETGRGPPHQTASSQTGGDNTYLAARGDADSRQCTENAEAASNTMTDISESSASVCVKGSDDRKSAESSLKTFSSDKSEGRGELSECASKAHSTVSVPSAGCSLRTTHKDDSVRTFAGSSEFLGDFPVDDGDDFEMETIPGMSTMSYLQQPSSKTGRVDRLSASSSSHAQFNPPVPAATSTVNSTITHSVNSPGGCGHQGVKDSTKVQSPGDSKMSQLFRAVPASSNQAMKRPATLSSLPKHSSTKVPAIGQKRKLTKASSGETSQLQKTVRTPPSKQPTLETFTQASTSSSKARPSGEKNCVSTSSDFKQPCAKKMGDGSENGQSAILPSCPLCQIEFSKGMTQMDIDGHIATCLSASSDDIVW